MKWCERCGRYFIPSLNRYVTSPATARGPIIDIADSVCETCMKPGEWWDENGLLRDHPREPWEDQQ